MKKKILSIRIIISSVLVLISSNYIIAQDSLPYLGQTPPGSISERFGSSFLLSDNSWTWFGAPVFSPDGKEMYFVKYIMTSDEVKLDFIKDDDGVWTSPQTPSFVENIRTESPFFLKDNNKLYIIKDSTGTNNPKIYTVERNAGGWNPAQLVEMPYNDALGDISNFSITNDSTIYFTLHTDLGAFIYKSRCVNGQYSEFEELPNQINSYNSSSPYIAPDESYIIFESDRPGSFGASDLYICFKDNNDNWTNAVNLGENINTSSYEYGASVSYDGKYLFFCSKRNDDINYNAYWVDISVINQFNLFLNIEESSTNLFQLNISPNPCVAQTTISFELEKSSKISIEIYDISGEKVTDLIENEKYPKGKNEILFKTSKLQPGTYSCILTLETGEKLSNKIIVLK